MHTATTTLHRLGARLEERQRRRRTLQSLRRELQTYSSPAEVEDLLVAIDRHDGPEAEQMRSILNAQVLRRQRSSWSFPIAS